MLDLLLKTIWLLIPAYTPNNFAVIFGGGMPIDMGKKFIDGRRILGDGKTLRGFIFGVLGGIICGVIQYYVELPFSINLFSSLAISDAFILISSLSIGSLTGDVAGSFIKRRLGKERGSALPFFDQLTFLIFAYLFAYHLSPHFTTIFTVNIIIAGLIITPVLHFLANYIAFKLGLKDVPW
jgi:CDP-2,3-bis-(O-geranylgeranyl)-sn-glycerol synthase